MAQQTHYDVLLSYKDDQSAVVLIARCLREKARQQPFLDRWHLVPGEPWQESLETTLNASRSCGSVLYRAGLCPRGSGASFGSHTGEYSPQKRKDHSHRSTRRRGKQ